MGGITDRLVDIAKVGVQGMDDRIRELETANKRLQTWVHDLQSGMYINCVYCGHRYGPDDEVPATMADALKEHIEACPEHPMSKLRSALQYTERVIEAAIFTEDGLDGEDGRKLLEHIGPLIRTPQEMDARTREIAGWPVV